MMRARVNCVDSKERSVLLVWAPSRLAGHCQAPVPGYGLTRFVTVCAKLKMIRLPCLLCTITSCVSACERRMVSQPGGDKGKSLSV
jgi:hypothetical protein